MRSAAVSQTPESVDICKRVREYQFSDDIPRYWAENNPVITAFYNALSSVVPEGEKFFIQSMRAGAKKVTDDKLRKDIEGFIAQEGSHSRAHIALNDWIKSQGYPVEEGNTYVKGLLSCVNRWFSLKQRLAFTTAIEHFSSVMSDRFVRYPEINHHLDSSIRDFLVWHCIEEIEHKSVAYDLYNTLYGGYFSRIFNMLFITVFFVPSVFGVQFKYLRHDGELFNMRAWWGAIVYFWLKPGWFSRVPSGYVKYFFTNFHPWKENNLDVVESWQRENSAISR